MSDYFEKTMTASPGNYRRCLSANSDRVVGAVSDVVCQTDALRLSPYYENPLSRHSVTRRTAKITREVQYAWNTRLGSTSTVIPADKILPLFHDLQIFPSHVQVNEMLQCAQKLAAHRGPRRYLTFSEFCIFAIELKKSVSGRISKYSREYFTRLLQKDGLNNKISNRSRRTVRKMCDSSDKKIFLGGSCNPTTWRRDEAIPILEKYGITFYNPQVSDWRPEMIELEHQAKQNAQILLYVIDNQTRNVVSLIETANFMGSRRNLIIVINLYKGPGHAIGSEQISTEEFNDLSTSLCLLKQLMKRRKIAVFTEINDAIKHAADIIRSSNENCEKFQNDLKLTRMKEAFESLDTEKCGLISSGDICKAFRLLTQKRSQSAELRMNIMKKIDEHSQTNHGNVKVNFEQFCRIVSELNLNCDKKYSNGFVDQPSNCSKYFRSLSTPDEKSTFTSGDDELRITDIYLGGDCYPHLNWRKKIAIPMIRKACLTFYNPENERRINQKLSSSEFVIINNSNVLLFVITNTSRSLFTMILASYYLGVGANVILCIQQLPDECVIGSDKISSSAVKDYNRGRLYLADMAQRENVPIYESIQDAIKAAIDKTIR